MNSVDAARALSSRRRVISKMSADPPGVSVVVASLWGLTASFVLAASITNPTIYPTYFDQRQATKLVEVSRIVVEFLADHQCGFTEFTGSRE